MRNYLPAFAILAVLATPAIAQSASPKPAPAAAENKTVKKIVCKRVENDGATGSRLSPTTKVCREVEVPAKDQQSKPSSDNHTH